jgi:hypothetical protein
VHFYGHTHDTAALFPNGNVVIYGDTEKSYASEYYNPSTNT